jgi:hypothetical protein
MRQGPDGQWYSADGRQRWDGQQWVATVPTAAPAPATPPRPSRLPKLWQVAAGALVLMIVVTVVANSYAPRQSSPAGSASATQPPAQAATLDTPTPIQTAEPTPAPAIATPNLTPTPIPSPPTPAPDPRALTVANVAKSLQDNQYELVGVPLDKLQVSMNTGGGVFVVVQPTVWDEGDSVKQAGRLAFVASKAILGWYPAAVSLRVQLLNEFSDTYGSKSIEPAETIDISLATAHRFSYDGLKDRVTIDPSIMYCDADHYQIHPAVWKNVDSKTRGCMVFAAS